MSEAPVQTATAATFAAVLFDLDGTLIDSAPGIHHRILGTFKAAGLPAPSATRVRNCIGAGARELVADLMGLAADDPAVAPVLQDYMQRCVDEPVINILPFPGITDALMSLQQQAVPMAVVTNKQLALSHLVLKLLGLAQWFPVVIGHDSTARPKPHPDPVLLACAELGVAPADCLLVGDSRHDVAAGKAAGCTVWAVDWGYNHGEPVANCNPDRVIDSPSALL